MFNSLQETDAIQALFLYQP